MMMKNTDMYGRFSNFVITLIRMYIRFNTFIIQVYTTIVFFRYGLVWLEVLTLQRTPICTYGFIPCFWWVHVAPLFAICCVFGFAGIYSVYCSQFCLSLDWQFLVVPQILSNVYVVQYNLLQVVAYFEGKWHSSNTRY